MGRGSACESEDPGSPGREHARGGFLFKIHSQVKTRSHVETARDALIVSACQMERFPVLDSCENQARRRSARHGGPRCQSRRPRWPGLRENPNLRNFRRRLWQRALEAAGSHPKASISSGCHVPPWAPPHLPSACVSSLLVEGAVQSRCLQQGGGDGAGRCHAGPQPLATSGYTALETWLVNSLNRGT